MSGPFDTKRPLGCRIWSKVGHTCPRSSDPCINLRKFDQFLLTSDQGAAFKTRNGRSLGIRRSRPPRPSILGFLASTCASWTVAQMRPSSGAFNTNGRSLARFEHWPHLHRLIVGFRRSTSLWPSILGFSTSDCASLTSFRHEAASPCSDLGEHVLRGQRLRLRRCARAHCKADAAPWLMLQHITACHSVVTP